MGGQAQIVVGTEVQDLAAIVEPDGRILDGDDDALFLEQAIGFNGVERFAEVGFHGTVHAGEDTGTRPHMRALKSWIR